MVAFIIARFNMLICRYYIKISYNIIYNINKCLDCKRKSNIILIEMKIMSFIHKHFLPISIERMFSHDSLGEDEQDAYVHWDPGGLLGRSVDCEVKSVVTRPALHPHLDHPSAHVS